MKITLIAGSQAQLDVLSQVVKAQGYTLIQTHIRDFEEPLKPLLSDSMGHLLLVECLPAQQKQDLLDLESFIESTPQVAVLMLSDAVNTEILVAAMQAGVREVLLSSATPADLSAALRRISQRKTTSASHTKTDAKVVSFLSCKGGSGATFLATNFAYIVAHELEKNTVLLDLDLQCGDAMYYVSPGSSKSDIVEVTHQIERLDAKLLASSVLHVSPGFDLLPAPEDPDATYTMEVSALDRLLEIVRKQYDMVVMDLDRVIGPLTTQAMHTSDVVFLVMENLLPYVRDAKRIVAKCRAMGYSDHKIRLVVNRYERVGTLDVEQIEKAVGLKVSYTIRSSFQDVAQAVNTGMPLSQVNTKNTIVGELRTMVQEFAKPQTPKPTTWLERLMGA